VTTSLNQQVRLRPKSELTKTPFQPHGVTILILENASADHWIPGNLMVPQGI